MCSSWWVEKRGGGWLPAGGVRVRLGSGRELIAKVPLRRADAKSGTVGNDLLQTFPSRAQSQMKKSRLHSGSRAKANPWPWLLVPVLSSTGVNPCTKSVGYILLPGKVRFPWAAVIKG